ncbi:unnamed protein product, partial [marine sediment metagenome]
LSNLISTDLVVSAAYDYDDDGTQAAGDWTWGAGHTVQATTLSPGAAECGNQVVTKFNESSPSCTAYGPAIVSIAVKEGVAGYEKETYLDAILSIAQSEIVALDAVLAERQTYKLINESFETVGLSGWTSVTDSGCSVDGDSFIPGTAPFAAGAECLKAFVVGGAANNAYIYKAVSNQNINYVRGYLYLR